MNPQPLLRVENLVVHFPILRGLLQKQVGTVHAVDEVNFDIHQGETLGLVGESGCGKSTTGRAIIQLQRPTAGKVIFEGNDLVPMKGEALRQTRRHMQMIFQDPYSSLNPRMTVRQLISEPMAIHNTHHGKEREERVAHLLSLVGLNPAFTTRYPHEFSGGQRQRIGIARALALEPLLIICDEPISALDVSVQAQVVNLMEDLQESLGLTYLMIAHDLSMVHHISNRVAVMYLGVIIELADKRTLFSNPLHPYTQALLSAVPILDPKAERLRRRIILQGDVPSPIHPPSGCRFRTRCPLAADICSEVKPVFREESPRHWVACHMVKA